MGNNLASSIILTTFDMEFILTTVDMELTCSTHATHTLVLSR